MKPGTPDNNPTARELFSRFANEKLRHTTHAIKSLVYRYLGDEVTSITMLKWTDDSGVTIAYRYRPDGDLFKADVSIHRGVVLAPIVWSEAPETPPDPPLARVK